MSTDGYRFGRKAAFESVLEHPLVGVEGRRTAITLAYLLGLVVLFAVSHAGSAIAIDGVVLDTVTKRFDTVRTVLIAFVTPTITLVPLCYAAWNGGPGLSFTLPLVPVVLGDVTAGQYVLDLDVAIALTAGAAAAAVAIVATDARRTGSVRPWRPADVDEDRLLFVTATTVVAAVGVARFVATAPAYVLEWYASVGWLWLVTGAIVGLRWLAWARARIEDRSGPEW